MSGTLNMGNNEIYNVGDLRFGAANLQRVWGDNSSALYYDSNHSTVTQILVRDLEGTQYTRVYGSGNGSNFGLLDRDGIRTGRCVCSGSERRRS